ncbi:hypothetical protein NG99_24395 [Erwinia typographi]|uniref:TrbI/VirB10 family protein n=1 Tax=Erwinia typographi TaxID=371042 RepID=A0A0A3YNG6_9GAMM|nr:VirB10/TraB/TrbI family type IV secretion system protein [Erwinia typographi]KGT87019.1 hypothetical protein NG99_24395 [Erwinia typographi]
MTDTQSGEKTLAELEREARARADAELKKSAPAEDKKPGQPEVNQLKKRGKNRVMTLGVLALAALIILAVTGDWAVTHYLRQPAASKETSAPKDKGIAAEKRQGMGQDAAPFGEQAQPDNGNSQPAEQAQTITLPPPVTFDKSLALAVSGGSSSGGQGGTVSRSAERGETSATATTDTPQVYTPCREALVKDASGKLVCPTATASSTGTSTVTGIQRITLDPDLYIPVDTYIPCTLQTRFVSDVAGRISCIISEDVYSASTHVRLIQAGTRARGVYKSGTLKHGQGRMFVQWTELRTPDGLKIPMVDSQVVGQLGESGIDGWVDTHFWERFGNAMLLSTVQDVAAAAADSAPGKDRNTDYTENSRAAAAEMAKTALDNSINIPPTIYKNQGDIIGMMTGSDIDFSGVYRLSIKGGRYGQ